MYQRDYDRPFAAFASRRSSPSSSPRRPPFLDSLPIRLPPRIALFLRALTNSPDPSPSLLPPPSEGLFPQPPLSTLPRPPAIVFMPAMWPEIRAAEDVTQRRRPPRQRLAAHLPPSSSVRERRPSAGGAPSPTHGRRRARPAAGTKAARDTGIMWRPLSKQSLVWPRGLGNMQ